MSDATRPHTSRKTRHDKGSIKANDRDILALTWIAQQYAARFDHVGELLARSPGPGAGDEGLSDSAVRQVVARWRRAKWVGYQQLLAGEPPWIWPTKEGLQAFGLTQYTAAPPALARIRHIHAVNAVRLLKQEDEDEWIGERDLRTGKFYARGERGHTPDAVFRYEEDGVLNTIAIEVELTQKKPDDLYKILHTLLNAWNEDTNTWLYNEVWYYVTDKGVEKAIYAAKGKQPMRRDCLFVFRFDIDELDIYEDEADEQ